MRADTRWPICGSGMMEEGGFIGVKNPDKAYDIETKYGYSAEEIFSSAFYNTRPEFSLSFIRKRCWIIRRRTRHPVRH